MKKCSNRKNQECNQNSTKKSPVVTGTSVRSKREVIVSIVQKYKLLIVKLSILKIRNIKLKKKSKDARCYLFSTQNLVKIRLMLAEEHIPLWQYLIQRNKNKQKNQFSKKMKYPKSKTNVLKQKLTLKDKKLLNHHPLESILQHKVISEHKDDYKLMRSGDVELNPGPPNIFPSTAGGKIKSVHKKTK